MKIVKKLVTALCACVVALGFAGCGGNKTPAGFKRILFTAAVDEYTSKYYTELYTEYNNTQGKEDKVYVAFQPAADSYLTSLSTMLSGRKSNAQVLMVNDKYFKNYAVQSRFVNLDTLLADENVRTVDASGNALLDVSELPAGLADRYRVDTATRKTGAGTDLYGMPFGDNPQVFFYNADVFKAVNINIVSVDEENLQTYNTSAGATLAPHGYAEYLTNPCPNAQPALVSSKNFAGKTVYKVFNNRIPMNWEEMIFMSKYMTPVYADANANVANVPTGVRYGL
ncbi:MAG: hypothetical protein K2L51_02200, partial [Clostridiales bacterium]|nr:hypothetical protein [Clostridiales bacterium]